MVHRQTGHFATIGLIRRCILMLILSAWMVPTAFAALTYNRSAALAYAAANYNKVVSDGYFWINSSTCQYYGAGVTVPTGAGIASGVGDDCAHFVSSCIGTPSGAGIAVYQPFAASTNATYRGQYGDPSASGLTSWLVSSGDAAYVSSVSALSAGDVISYDWDGGGSIDHTVLYLGSGLIAAHATSHFGTAWNWAAPSYSNLKYTFVHITLPDAVTAPEPTMLTACGGLLMAVLRRRSR